MGSERLSRFPGLAQGGSERDGDPHCSTLEPCPSPQCWAKGTGSGRENKTGHGHPCQNLTPISKMRASCQRAPKAFKRLASLWIYLYVFLLSPHREGFPSSPQLPALLPLPSFFLTLLPWLTVSPPTICSHDGRYCPPCSPGDGGAQSSSLPQVL